jgi:HEAT repeat protein
MPKSLTSTVLAIVLGLLVAAGSSSSAAPPEVDALIKQLSDKDESVRLKAAKELGKLKEKAKDAIPALKVATTDADEDVREVAKKALAAIKEATDKIDAAKVDEKLVPLIKDMRSKDNKVRLAAIAKLEELGADAKPAGAAIVEYGMMSPNTAVKNAANAAFEKIDPLVHKEIITVYYDEDEEKKNAAVTSLQLMGSKAKAAVPIIKGYHQFLVGKHRYTPSNTLAALVKIAPDDESVQAAILALVGGSDSALPRSNIRGRDREFVVKLMHELKIDDKQKLAPLVSGIAAAGRFYERDREMMIAELGKLRVENKEKYPALMMALSKNMTERALIINELAKLGTDAKGALPVLMALKTDKEEAVRIAANNAIEAIK